MDALTLDDILESGPSSSTGESGIRDTYRAFLKHTHCEENLLFYDAVKDFHLMFVPGNHNLVSDPVCAAAADLASAVTAGTGADDSHRRKRRRSNITMSEAMGSTADSGKHVSIGDRVNDDAARKIAAAKHIYDEYLQSASMNEINIDSNDRDTIENGWKNRDVDVPAKEIFDDAFCSVYHLMESDCVPRFLKSKHYTEYTERAAIMRKRKLGQLFGKDFVDGEEHEFLDSSASHPNRRRRSLRLKNKGAPQTPKSKSRILGVAASPMKSLHRKVAGRIVMRSPRSTFEKRKKENSSSSNGGGGSGGGGSTFSSKRTTSMAISPITSSPLSSFGDQASPTPTNKLPHRTPPPSLRSSITTGQKRSAPHIAQRRGL